MNPETNRFEELKQDLAEKLIQREPRLLRPDGSPVPEHWSIFTVDEHVNVKNYTFKVAYIGEQTLLLEPVGPILVGVGRNEPCPCGSDKKFKRCCGGPE